MRFLFNCSGTLIKGATGSCYFSKPATRRVWVKRSDVSQLVPRRAFASISADSFVQNCVDIPVGGNGSIKLNILKPTTNSVEANSNTIIYLPQGPIFSNEKLAHPRETTTTLPFLDEAAVTENATPQKLLARTTGSTVVTVNYRLGYMNASPSPQDGDAPLFHRHPTPVHDTLAGLDWVLGTIDPEQLCVVGTNIGGSLALMLALTEFKTIHAIAAYEPICDWTGLDDYCTVDPNDIAEAVANDIKKKNVGTKSDQDIELELLRAQVAQIKQGSRHRRKSAPADLVPLLRAREYLFQAPSKYFDAFASPMLFLRSAGKDPPKTFPKYHTGPEYSTPVLKKPNVAEDLVDLWDVYIQADEEASSAQESNDNIEQPARRRKALSRWPPYGLDYGANSGVADGVEKLDATLPLVKLFARSNTNYLDGSPTEPGSAVVDQDLNNNNNAKRRAKPLASQDSVLADQAKEMVSVLRRACFWGREKGYGEQRVSLACLPRSDSIGTANAKNGSNNDAADLADLQVDSAISEAALWFNRVSGAND
ncbi:hypothetical protein BGW36DRAFT_297918 [Talaromyces proteolyticus]|uniref:Alpha/beta hydrolase fold-3 domain-containing protein n=1 Tax=Talaromyces proteolyticus TaxID=1131652 RepID=A0AAD4KPC0_9EURO|nr:uncharacterized protein BGW36DRAFT_297918 [Talaromyces proteolyticus]KAH8696226.1 hypothetical protein BGW36DRAFT_297918 [Talaromyces proteolyticus]